MFYRGEPWSDGVEAPDLSGWLYDSDSSVLTLDNFTWNTLAPDALVILGANHLTIHLADGSSNSIISACDVGEDDSSGIYVYNCSLTIQGTGTLNVRGGPANFTSYGICLEFGDITINSGTVVATSGNSDDESYGIYVKENMIIRGGTVTAKGGETTGESSMSFGINAYEIIISGGTVTATGCVSAMSGEDEGGVSVTAETPIGLTPKRAQRALWDL